METRRASDHDRTAEIEKMIAEETDPRIRVQLLMMHSLTASVSNIGVTVNDLDEKFTKHATKEEALVNQVKGAWRVAAWVFGIAQAIVVWVYLDMHADVKSVHEAQQQDVVAHERLGARLSVLEEKMK